MNTKIMGVIRKYDYLFVAIFLSVVYFLVVLSFGYLSSLDKTLFWTPDARSYIDEGEWLFGIKYIQNPLARTFFYPLLLVIAQAIKKDYIIWFFQLVLWVFSGVLLYWSVKTITKNTILKIASVIIYASNLTLMLLTLHALTEVLVVFLLTVLVTLITHKQYFKEYYWFLVILVASLLTVTKPVFLYLLIIILIYLTIIFMRSNIKREFNWKLFGLLFLALLPVIIQLAINKIKVNEYSISNIGPITVKEYYFARVYGDVNSIPVKQAREYIKSFDQREIIRYLITHFAASVRTYIKALSENFLTYSSFINYPKPNIFLFYYMVMVNVMYSIIHLFMIPFSIIVLIDLVKKKSAKMIEIIISLLVPISLIFFTSGITFWQGDRVVLPSLPLWITLYSLVISLSWEKITKKSNSVLHI